jgi:hypothetical protein
VVRHNGLHMCCGRGGGASAAADRLPALAALVPHQGPRPTATMCLLCRADSFSETAWKRRGLRPLSTAK